RRCPRSRPTARFACARRSRRAIAIGPRASWRAGCRRRLPSWSRSRADTSRSECPIAPSSSRASRAGATGARPRGWGSGGHLALGTPARAAELARVAVRGDGGPPARLGLGRALRAQGRLGEAAEVLASIEPGSGAWPDGPIELAETLEAAGRPALAAEV